jgi:hypothetical protein
MPLIRWYASDQLQPKRIRNPSGERAKGAEMGPLLRTRGEREERADHQQAAKGQDHTGCTVQDGSHHLHLPAVNLEVGRQGTFANASGFGHERAVSLGWAAGPRAEVK